MSDDDTIARLNARLRVSRLAAQMQAQQSATDSATAEIEIRFHEGPKAEESVTLTVPAHRGPPQQITVGAIDPDTYEIRKGNYRQSPLSDTLYVWDGWAGPAEPITKA